MTVSLPVANPTTLAVQLLQHGGTNSGAQIAGGTVPPGQTNFVISSSLVGSTDSTSHEIQLTQNATLVVPITITYTISVTYADAIDVLCQYGTEKQATAQAVQYLTPALVDLVLTAVAMPEAAILFDGLWFSTLNLDEMCGELPPPAPIWNNDSLQWASETIKALFITLAWPYFCQCKAGATTPTSPPSPHQPVPPGWPSPLVFSCAPDDLCASLVKMQQQLASMQKQLFSVFELTTLLQRYQLPFAYIPGRQHLSLSGSASFAISRLIGLKVTLRAGTSGLPTFPGNPTYVKDVGWMSVSDPNGMLQEKRITRNQMVWLPPSCADATLFGYYLNPGVTVDVQELQAEP